jgi:hypothetical protein
LRYPKGMIPSMVPSTLLGTKGSGQVFYCGSGREGVGPAAVGSNYFVDFGPLNYLPSLISDSIEFITAIPKVSLKLCRLIF